jgi:hypothetical protein
VLVTPGRQARVCGRKLQRLGLERMPSSSCLDGEDSQLKKGEGDAKGGTHTVELVALLQDLLVHHLPSCVREPSRAVDGQDLLIDPQRTRRLPDVVDCGRASDDATEGGALAIRQAKKGGGSEIRRNNARIVIVREPLSLHPPLSSTRRAASVDRKEVVLGVVLLDDGFGEDRSLMHRAPSPVDERLRVRGEDGGGACEQ